MLILQSFGGHELRPSQAYLLDLVGFLSETRGHFIASLDFAIEACHVDYSAATRVIHRVEYQRLEWLFNVDFRSTEI